jgi:hypothetical protein
MESLMLELRIKPLPAFFARALPYAVNQSSVRQVQKFDERQTC